MTSMENILTFIRSYPVTATVLAVILTAILTNFITKISCSRKFKRKSAMQRKQDRYVAEQLKKMKLSKIAECFSNGELVLDEISLEIIYKIGGVLSKCSQMVYDEIEKCVGEMDPSQEVDDFDNGEIPAYLKRLYKLLDATDNDLSNITENSYSRIHKKV